MSKDIALTLFTFVLMTCPFAGMANQVTFNDIATEVGLASEVHTQGSMPAL